MRKLYLLPLMLLAGCQTPIGNTGSTVSDAYQAFQTATVQACAFLPLASTIAAILDTKSPGLSTPFQVAGAICAAVVPSAAKSAAAFGPAKTPTVAGVAVRGDFVR